MERRIEQARPPALASDGHAHMTSLYLGVYAGCLVGLLIGAVFYGALFTPASTGQWFELAGGALAVGAAFLTATAACVYLPARALASRGEAATLPILVRIVLVAAAGGLSLAVVVSIVAQSFAMTFGLIAICFFWCMLPGVVLAPSLSRRRRTRRCVIAGIVVASVIGGIAASLA